MPMTAAQKFCSPHHVQCEAPEDEKPKGGKHDRPATSGDTERERSAPHPKGSFWMRWLLIGGGCLGKAVAPDSMGFELELGDANLLSDEHGTAPLGN